jgi:hypothetical protein
MKVEWTIVYVIVGWAITIVLYIYSIIKGKADKNEDKAEKFKEQKGHAELEAEKKDLSHGMALLLKELEIFKIQNQAGQDLIKRDLEGITKTVNEYKLFMEKSDKRWEEVNEKMQEISHTMINYDMRLKHFEQEFTKQELRLIELEKKKFRSNNKTA